MYDKGPLEILKSSTNSFIHNEFYSTVYDNNFPCKHQKSVYTLTELTDDQK